MKVCIMGRPGAGKGTQSVAISEYYKIPHISTGEMFRTAIENETEVGLIAKTLIENGQLAPDDVTIALVKERLSEGDCENGFLLDGFPRTLVQADALEEYLNNNGFELDAVINVSVATESIIERMAGRRVCKNCGSTFHIKFNPSKVEGVCDVCGHELVQREDDLEETVKKRLAVYDEETAPLLRFYAEKNLLKTINGNQPLDKVFDDIKAVLGA